MATIEVKVPDIGDFKDIPVIEVFVKPGDTVAAEDSLVTLESDKATMDVPSPAAGIVKEVHVKVGDKVSEGSLIVVLDSAAAATAPSQPASGAKAGAAASAPPAAATATPAAPAAPPPRRFPARRPRTPARSTSNARCSCWARARAVTAPRSAPRISG